VDYLHDANRPKRIKNVPDVDLRVTSFKSANRFCYVVFVSSIVPAKDGPNKPQAHHPRRLRLNLNSQPMQANRDTGCVAGFNNRVFNKGSTVFGFTPMQIALAGNDIQIEGAKQLSARLPCPGYPW